MNCLDTIHKLNADRAAELDREADELSTARLISAQREAHSLRELVSAQAKTIAALEAAAKREVAQSGSVDWAAVLFKLRGDL